MKEALVDLNRERETFVHVVREHQKVVFSVAYAKLRNVHDAEDVKQEVFVEAWRNFHKLRSPEKVKAWLYAITISRCKDHLRKNFRRERREVDYMQSNPKEVTNPQGNPELHERVLKEISRLPEKIRIVIMLKHLAQLSYDEISKVTGLSKTTIDGRLRAGKRKMRQQLVESENQ
jgi:RNA polymerase sigma-70 factor (ECF subfamily)